MTVTSVLTYLVRSTIVELSLHAQVRCTVGAEPNYIAYNATLSAMVSTSTYTYSSSTHLVGFEVRHVVRVTRMPLLSSGHLSAVV